MLPQTSAFVIETLPRPPAIDRFYAKTPATAASDLGLIVMPMQALVIFVLLLVVNRRRLLVRTGEVGLSGSFRTDGT
jgi:hypothetical protein